MVFDVEKCENILIECVETKNEHQFQYILDELKINPNKKLKCFDWLSTFEKVLMTPNSKRFIEMCMYNGSAFCKKNDDGIYPLHYAVDSLSVENLETILKPMNESSTPLCDDHLSVTQYSMIINEKLEGGNNYLHLLISNITEENCEEVFEMIMVMVNNGCSVNSPNDQLQTPLLLLLQNPHVKTSSKKYFIENVRIDYISYNSDDVGRIMEKWGLQFLMPTKMEDIVNIDLISQHLEDWTEQKLISNLEVLKCDSQEFRNDVLRMLEEAIVKNLSATVSVLMTFGVDINDIPKNSKFKMTPSFLACILGYHQVLKVLLNDPNLSFQSNNSQRNLLHQIFSSDSIDANDRKKCFDLIIADKRCTLEVINLVDSQGCTPLFLACQYGCDEITKELLRRGAYIGHESVLNYMQKDVLESFLDECVKCSSEINDRNHEIYIDYKFLMPPDKSLEISSVHSISDNSKLKDFILHPVIASFVLLKWRKIEPIVYFNLLVYFGFMLFLGFIIVNFYNVTSNYGFDKEFCSITNQYHESLFGVKMSEFTFQENAFTFDNSSDSVTQFLFENLPVIMRLYNKSNSSETKFKKWSSFQTDEQWKTRFRRHFVQHAISYWFGIFGLLLMTAYEVGQCAMSWKKYFLKPINWLDILQIGFSFFVLVKNIDVGCDNFKHVCAVMILLVGAQGIHIFSKVSAFSLSLHMAILSKVCRTFLKTIAPYLIIITAFGMSFYALNFTDYLPHGRVDSSENKGFSNPFLSTISTVRMMLSDFGAVTIKTEDHFQGILFLAFMIFISIVLFNLLNALAISDTNEMMKVAEFIETKNRISTLRTYDTAFSIFKITYANVFPKLTTILLTPNIHSAIKVKQRVQMSDNVAILMQNTGRVSNYEYLHADWVFWKKTPEPMTFDEKCMKKILDFVNNQQEEHTSEMNKNSQELQALRMAQEDISKELQILKNSQKTLQAAVDEQSNILKAMLSKSERF